MLKIAAGLVASATDVSDSAQAVADELARARSAHGPQRLRNDIERELVSRWSRGNSILDVGIGTGRMSLGLATGERWVTGLDRSRLMIERCGAEASGRQVKLIEGDLRAMPFADGEFATVVSIDTLRPGPAWATQLAEALRVTEPGGRLIIDAHSSDHSGNGDRCRAEPGLRLSVIEVAEFARSHGASIRAIVPYGAVFDGALGNSWLSEHSAGDDRFLDHLFSWIGVDQELYAFALFIERRIVGELTPRCAARMMIVFERLPNDARSEDTLERFARIDAALAAGSFDFAEIAGRHEGGANVWANEWSAHLANARNRAFAAVLLDRIGSVELMGGILTQLPAGLRRELERKRFDSHATSEAARLTDIVAQRIGAQLDFHGVSIAWALAPALGGELGAVLRAKR